MNFRVLLAILFLLAGTLFNCRQNSGQGLANQSEGAYHLTEVPSINGRWAKSDTSNISFRVEGDSLFMFEDPVGVFYEIKGDSFVCYFDGAKFSYPIIKITSDTLIFIEYGDTTRLFRMR